MKDYLDLLRGTVRPLITFALTGAVIAGFFLNKLPPDALLAAATMAMGFWFASRKASA